MIATPKTAAAIAANRFGLGARPGELAVVGSDPDGWLLRQLDGAPPVLKGDGLHPSAETLAKALELRQQMAEQRREKKDASNEKPPVAAALKLPALYRPVYIDEIASLPDSLQRRVTTDQADRLRTQPSWTRH